jgi:DNA-binding GntR family transcriptional regulator
VWWMAANKKNFRALKPQADSPSLREQVCDYLRKEIAQMSIRPGVPISLRKASSELGIGITPLRDALLQLEGEGMVTILPRRGIFIREFTLKDVKNYYETIGAIEALALKTAILHITKDHCTIMRQINKHIFESTKRGYFSDHLKLNKTFHNTYLNLSENTYLPSLWNNITSRLYYSPTEIVQMEDWDRLCCDHHDHLIDALEERDLEGAIHWMRDEHWSFRKQKKYIEQYYHLKSEE